MAEVKTKNNEHEEKLNATKAAAAAAEGSNSTSTILQSISHISQNKYFLVTDFENNNNNNDDDELLLLSSSSSSKTTTTTKTTNNVKDYLWKQWKSMVDDLISIKSEEAATSTTTLENSAALSSNNNDVKQHEEDHNQNQDYYYKEWFDKIYEHYNEPINQRYYHTPVHLYEMFEYLSIIVLPLLSGTSYSSDDDDDITEQQQSSLLLMMKPALSLAIFFHDVIYDSKSNANEKDSYDLFLEFAIDVNKKHQQPYHVLLSSKVIGQVKTLILATIKHKPILSEDNINNDEYCNIDIQKLFLDIDMAVLGKSSHDAYLSYASSIRKEYIWVEHDIYCTKRIQILQTFLNNHTQIYMSDIFYDTLESYARQNLQTEITLLQQGTIPGENDEKIYKY